MLLQGSEVPLDLRIHDINTAFKVLSEPLDGIQLWAVHGQPHEDDVLWYRHVRWGLVQQDWLNLSRQLLKQSALWPPVLPP